MAFFYNGVKSFLSHLRKNVGLGCSKVGCWEMCSTKDWRSNRKVEKMHNGKLNDSWNSLDITKGVKIKEEEMRVTRYMLVGKAEGNRRLGRPRPRKEYNIKLGLEEIGCEDVDWINLARNMYKWQDCLKTAFPKMRENPWVAGENNRPKFYARRIWAQLKFSLKNFCLFSSHLKTWILKYISYVTSKYHEIFTKTKFNKSSRSTDAPGWSIKVFVLSYGFEIWSLRSRERCRLDMFEY